jgi:peptidoglycan hydrolase CwlO-like protein
VAAIVKANSALQNELDFVRSQFAEAYNKNQDLYNEIKDLQAVIKYLENQVVKLIKPN